MTDLTELVPNGLRRIAKGGVFDDEWIREIYSVDASHFSLRPLAVVNPIDKYDIQKICQYRFTNILPITAGEQEQEHIRKPASLT